MEKKHKHLRTLKALRIIRFALNPDTFHLISSLESAHKIWNRLKELYSGEADLTTSLQTSLLSEYGSFEQKYDETIIQSVNRVNHLLIRMLKHGLKREHIEQKVTFLNGLRPEWKTFVSTVKAHEQFKNYSPAQAVGRLKYHEDEKVDFEMKKK